MNYSVWTGTVPTPSPYLQCTPYTHNAHLAHTFSLPARNWADCRTLLYEILCIYWHPTHTFSLPARNWADYLTLLYELLCIYTHCTCTLSLPALHTLHTLSPCVHIAAKNVDWPYTRFLPAAHTPTNTNKHTLTRTYTHTHIHIRIHSHTRRKKTLGRCAPLFRDMTAAAARTAQTREWPCTHTHTHTHTYIYIYIYIYTSDASSDPNFPNVSAGMNIARRPRGPSLATERRACLYV